MQEQWKECCDGWYEVSDQGRVRRAKPCGGTYVGRLLKPRPARGYHDVCVSIKGKHYYHGIHRLVASVFLGPCPPGMEVNHKDGVKTNNRVDNLEYVTSTENNLHALRTGLTKCKYPQATIDEIRRLRSEGRAYTEIATITGVSGHYCWRVANGLNRTTDWGAAAELS